MVERNNNLLRYYPNGRIMDKLHWKNKRSWYTNFIQQIWYLCQNQMVVDGEFIKYSVPPLKSNIKRKKHPKFII